MNIVQAIPNLYPLTGNGTYKAEFENVEDARVFSLGIRDQLKDLGIGVDHSYNIVEQRNTNVYIDIDEANRVLQLIEEESLQTV
jgi:hypothetical protein